MSTKHTSNGLAYGRERECLSAKEAYFDEVAVTTFGPLEDLVEMPTNPKQLYGDLKVPVQLVPPTAIAYLALGFRDGADKYGQFNWRQTKVEAMTYIGAAQRHIMAYLDGEYTDPDSGNPHIAHAMSCLAIAADAHEGGFLLDNRPPPGPGAKVLNKYMKEESK